MKKGKVGIVIVNYNGEKFQNKALETICSSDYTNYEIIIVDSHSSDNSIKMAKEEYPQVHYLLQSENVGVAKGNNIGIKYALEALEAEYVLLLNNDIELDGKTISELVREADEKTITVPKIYYYDPKEWLWYAGGQLLWKKGESLHFGITEPDEGQYDEKKKVDYAPTCCMLIHRDVFQKIGYIEEAFFMYFDDTDFCVRLNEAGYSIMYIPSARMWHKVSSSSGGLMSPVYVYYYTRNKLYYMKRYTRYIPIKARIYTFLKAIQSFIINPLSLNKYIIKGWKDYLKGNMGRCDTLFR